MALRIIPSKDNFIKMQHTYIGIVTNPPDCGGESGVGHQGTKHLKSTVYKAAPQRKQQQGTPGHQKQPAIWKEADRTGGNIRYYN